MKKVLKWIGIVLGGLLGILLIAAVILHFVGKSKLETAPKVTGRPVTVPSDAETVARGAKWVTPACTGCHGANLEGTVFFDNLPAPNLTSGQGGIGRTYTDEDWEMALRHGVGKDGRPLVIMPSADFSNFDNADTAAIIAYLKTLPPVDNELPPRKISFPFSILFGIVIYDEIIGAAVKIAYEYSKKQTFLPNGA